MFSKAIIFVLAADLAASLDACPSYFKSMVSTSCTGQEGAVCGLDPMYCIFGGREEFEGFTSEARCYGGQWSRGPYKQQICRAGADDVRVSDDAPHLGGKKFGRSKDQKPNELQAPATPEQPTKAGRAPVLLLSAATKAGRAHKSWELPNDGLPWGPAPQPGHLSMFRHPLGSTAFGTKQARLKKTTRFPSKIFKSKRGRSKSSMPRCTQADHNVANYCIAIEGGFYDTEGVKEWASTNGHDSPDGWMYKVCIDGRERDVIEYQMPPEQMGGRVVSLTGDDKGPSC